MRPWQFGKPKTPGFGISEGYYLTILSSKAVLPSILQVVSPAGQGGAAEGFGAPLDPEATKQSLSQPLERGAYAVTTKDRKTVLKMLVMNKDEAGYDPEAFARSEMAEGAEPELLARMRGTWTLMQLTFKSHDPMVYASLDFFLGVAARLADLSEGVVADAICQRYLLPWEVFHKDRLDPRIDARDHVAVKFRTHSGGLHAYTVGMQKFNLHEFEISGLLEGDQTAAAMFLLTLAQTELLGQIAREGDRVGSDALPFEVRTGGFDPALWEGIAVFELLPPTRSTPSEALTAWTRETGAS